MEKEKKKVKEKETDNKDEEMLEETLIESGLQTSRRMRKEAWGWAAIILTIAVLVLAAGRGIHSWYQSTVVGRAPSVVTTVEIQGNQIKVSLPEPKIVPEIPADAKQATYISSNNWWNKNPITLDDQKEAFEQARKEMGEAVMNDESLIKRAETRYKSLLHSFIDDVNNPPL